MEVTKTKRKPTGAAALGPGPGRPKGSKNKLTSDLREMVLRALYKAGGADYLLEQAKQPNPSAFLALVGKCLPKDMRVTATVTLTDLLREVEERRAQSVK